MIRLPPPELVIFVGTAAFLTRKLRLDVRTLPFLVLWSGSFISHPFSAKDVTVFLCFANSKRKLLCFLVTRFWRRLEGKSGLKLAKDAHEVFTIENTDEEDEC